MKKNETIEKIKKLLEWLKKAWANPRKKAGIKLLGYLLLFIFIFVFAAIGSRMDKTEIQEEQTVKEETDYSKELKELQKSKLNVTYTIFIDDKKYSISGLLENNILSGYIEYDESIKKIMIMNNNIYEIKNEDNVLFESNINASLLDINHIIDLMSDIKPIINLRDDKTEYSYTINSDENIIINILVDNTKIERIEVKSEDNIYELVFNI